MTLDVTELSQETVVGRFQARSREWTDTALWYLKDDNGAWDPITWGGARLRVESIAAGLMALGIERDDRVGLVGKNRPSWVATDYGIQHTGAIGVPIYATSAPEQISYVLGHSGSRIYFVDDQEQLDKALAADLPSVERIIAHHLDQEDDGRVMGIGRLREIGAEWREQHTEILADRMRSVGPDDVLSIIYTSGTTGPPKGVVITQHNGVWTAEATTRRLGLQPSETVISYLPLSHVFERLVTTLIPLASAETQMAFYFVPELPELPGALREVRPTLFVAVPRVWQKFQARILAEVAEAPALRRRIFHLGTFAGAEAVRHRDDGSSPSLGNRLGALLGRRVVGRQVVPKLGLDRCWYAVSGAAPLSPELQRFFQGMGLPLHQGWGMTETTAACTVQPPENLEVGLVGAPLDGVEVRLEDDGEILVRGPNVFRGYFREHEMTAETLRDGWLHTGDIGEIASGGRLVIIDRKKDLIITAGGKNVAPAEIEQSVKAASQGIVAETMVIGDGRPYLVALMSLDADEAKTFLHHKGEQVDDAHAMAAHPLIEDRIRLVVEDVNQRLSRAESIRKWKIVPGGFPPDAITPTLKLKRKVVGERFADDIEALYV